MIEINQLRESLRHHLGWHGARASFLALFIVALFRVKTVNLAELANAFANRAQAHSSYKRLKRFFAHFEVKQEIIARLVVTLSGIPEPWTLSVDRTNWSFGQVHFNILMLGVVHSRIAFPLLWTMLHKQGNSNSAERMDLLERFETLFPQVKVACLTADREFVGKEWVSFWMMSPLIPFRIRRSHSELISSGSGKTRCNGAAMFHSLPYGQTRILSCKRWVWGRKLYVVGWSLADGQLLIVATNISPKTALTDYAQRWGIETLFAALKTLSFNLESTHFQDGAKLNKLVALLAIAFTWARRVGLWLHRQKPIPLKSHGRRAKSLFRFGCDFLQRTFCDFTLRRSEFRHALQLLSLY